MKRLTVNFYKSQYQRTAADQKCQESKQSGVGQFVSDQNRTDRGNHNDKLTSRNGTDNFVLDVDELWDGKLIHTVKIKNLFPFERGR